MMTMRSMRMFGFLIFAGLLALEVPNTSSGAADPEAARNWPQWRGPFMTGVAPEAAPPLTWSETENIRWKREVPGAGTATPIVWGERVFILTAVNTGKKAEAPPPAAVGPASGGPPSVKPGGEIFQFKVLCLNRKDGKTLWEKVAREEAPHEGHHPDHGFASASPVTDGKVVLAYFGSRGLHCYDMDGQLKWSKDFGRMHTRNTFGEGASPALWGSTVVVVWDDETDNDFIVALDKQTGKELWRTPRNEATGWSTPLVVDYEGKPQVVVSATGKVRSYSLEDGKEIWECAGQTANAIPTPVASKDTLYATSGFRGSALYAIALGHSGDLAGTDAIRWVVKKNTPYVPSPLLVNGRIYVLSGNNAVLSCFEAASGAPVFEGEKLEGLSGVYASPVAAGDRVYVLGRNGVCVALKEGKKLEVLATNKLDDKSDSTPALVGKDIFIRGHQSLYCISAEK
jgi:outer membrane protein assembly factor BamB